MRTRIGLFVIAWGIATTNAPAPSGPFVPTGPMAVSRCDHTATLLTNGMVLVAGGETKLCGCCVAPTATAELYDPRTGTWTMTGSMTTPRENHTATLLADGRVLVAGGSGDVAPTLRSTAEIYDPATGSWRPTGTMNFGRDQFTATLLPSGEVLAAGGYGVEGNYYNSLTSAELFDPATDAWTITGSLNEKRSDHSAALLPNGKVLIVGGYGDVNDALSTADYYDPAVGGWIETAPVPSYAPTVCSATLLPNAKLLVADVGQLYDADSGTWTATAAYPPSVAAYCSATLLSDGQVLIAGGYRGGGILSNATLYVPETMAWKSAGAMTTMRKDHTATRLWNGNVLIAGGYRGYCGVLSNAELYTATNVPLTPVLLTNPALLAGGAFQFGFTSSPGARFSILASADARVPITNWTALQGLMEMPPGHFQFSYSNDRSFVTRFFRAIALP